jgi:hypothetical protein
MMGWPFCLRMFSEGDVLGGQQAAVVELEADAAGSDR